MAYPRKLPSGKWQVTVTLPHWARTTEPDGTIRKKVSRTSARKADVMVWATQLEAELQRGRWHDPRPGHGLTVAEWRAQWAPTRIIENTTRNKDDVHWRLRVDPKWGSIPLTEVTRLNVRQWVAAMRADGIGPDTIKGTVHHFGAILSGAVGEDLLDVNPVHGVELPTSEPRDEDPFSVAEVTAILAELDEPYRTLADLGTRSGLRFGELAGLDIVNVDFALAQLRVRQVIERHDRTPRKRLKTKASKRIVPIDHDLLVPLARLAGDRKAGLIFRGPQGGPLTDVHFRARVWKPALARAGVPYRSPHNMRHTAASWLVMAGVDLYRVQALLGHESASTTQKYAHLMPDAHGPIREAWALSARRAHASDPLRELDR